MSTKPQPAKVTVEIGDMVYTMELDTCTLEIQQDIREVLSDGLYRKFEPGQTVTTALTGRGSKTPIVKGKDE